MVLVGFTMGIPDSIMGITFLAAGTSVPDAMASVMVAKQGMLNYITLLHLDKNDFGNHVKVVGLRLGVVFG